MLWWAEHARKIGIWAATFVVSPFAGPFLSGITVYYTGDWRKSMWVDAGLIGFGLLLVCTLGEETMYTPSCPGPKGKGLLARISALVGITEYKMKHKGVGKMAWDMVIMASRPHFFILCSKLDGSFSLLF